MSTFKRASLDRAELLTPMSMSDALDAMTLDLKRLSRAGVSRSVVEASMASAVIHITVSEHTALEVVARGSPNDRRIENANRRRGRSS